MINSIVAGRTIKEILENDLIKRLKIQEKQVKEKYFKNYKRIS